MEHRPIDPSRIPGWGSDADANDRPNYPIKQLTGDDHQRIHWKRPSLQANSVEILKSTERPYITAVFGTTQPPKGLSGALRRVAFRYSENMNRRWLLLLLADRINSLEGMLGDVLFFRFPNYIGEHGGRALWKYKPWSLVGKLLLRTIVIAAIVTLVILLIKKPWLSS